MVSAVLLNARSGFAGTVLSLCAVSLSTYLVVACLQAQAVMSWFVLQAVFLAARALGVARSSLLGSDGLHPVPLDARSRRVAPVPECRAHLWVGRFLVP